MVLPIKPKSLKERPVHLNGEVIGLSHGIRDRQHVLKEIVDHPLGTVQDSVLVPLILVGDFISGNLQTRFTFIDLLLFGKGFVAQFLVVANESQIAYGINKFLVNGIVIRSQFLLPFFGKGLGMICSIWSTFSDIFGRLLVIFSSIRASTNLQYW